MLASIGLSGDGDEVDAIEKAFERFGIEVPVSDASKWVTVGDVWASLCHRLPEASKQPDAFLRFCSELCYEPGTDPHKIDLQSRLLL